MKKFELVFIPGPGMGHLASTVEMANVIVARDHRLSVTVLTINPSSDPKIAQQIQSFSASFAAKSIRFIALPEPPLPEETKNGFRLKQVLQSYKPHVREAVTNLTNTPESPPLVGFVIDMFCTAMIDVAKEFEVPCYVFYTSSASFLALSFHLQQLYHQNDSSNHAVEHLKDSNDELAVPGFVNSIPGKVIPSVFFESEIAAWFHDNARRFRSEVKGILINTFAEMEPHVMNGSSQIPPLYSVGPVLHLRDTSADGSNKVHDAADTLKWLDDQPPSSVVFLCFGSMGSFDQDQVEEIARALEQSGVRFLWSLRRPPPKGKLEAPSDYADIKDVLPEGFLDRTADVGRVIGWAPQVEILAHPATGGFVSHCGWNSTLESVWHGVPMATWPMYAEQQFNAYELVVELGLAVEITVDFRKEFRGERSRIVSAEEIESGIRRLMEDNNEIKEKVKAKSEESRKSVLEGGSSFVSLGHFIDDVIANSLGGRD
ncbi:anthocyanidin 3-O-glucosyltransferase 2-like [Momordica charantia]|uniref:Glycosyltransferase n=1 Tax=Momordica charantia TaxID=3673 RepID=A0A6J1CLT2_MOMCH|nr:anthocyanidin 3-O-glucosyltransferase 2-like [Momordica charantia]